MDALPFPHGGSPTVLVVAPGAARQRALRERLLAAGLAVVGESHGEDDASLYPATVAVIDVTTTPGPAPDLALPAVLIADWEAELIQPFPRSGAPRAYLSRDASLEELAAAVLAVHAGLTVFDATAVAALAEESAAAPSALGTGLDEHLTPREVQVLREMAAGLPNKGIARQLEISENTVKYHVAAILAKLGAQSRAEAVMLGARHGLIPL